MYEKFAYEGNEVRQVFIKDFGVVLLNTATSDHFDHPKKYSFCEKMFILKNTYKINTSTIIPKSDKEIIVSHCFDKDISFGTDMS